VGENAVYLAQADRLAAWDVADGRPLWPPVVFDSDISAAPVAVGDQVVVATGGDQSGVGPRVWWLGSDSTLIRQSLVDAPLTELGAAAGTLVYIDESGVGRIGDTAWHTPVDGVESITLAADHGLALVTSADGAMTAFDVDNGAQRWRYDAGEPITRPALAGDRLFIAAGELGVIAIAVADGRLAWRRPLGTSVQGAPAYAQDLVWVAAFDARLHAFKAGNGTLMGGLTIELSSRNYLDLVSFDPWVVAGPLYGPWIAVRRPTRVERADLTVRVRVRQPNTVGRPDLEIPAGVGPAGVAVVNGNGSVSFLQPQRSR
jgi:outer membrane protein assembly factor BamB